MFRGFLCGDSSSCMSDASVHATDALYSDGVELDEVFESVRGSCIVEFLDVVRNVDVRTDKSNKCVQRML